MTAGRTVALFEERFGALPRGGGPAALQELVRRLGELPYENLTKILALHEAGGPSLRQPGRVMADHLELGTGGTCFSLTELARRLAGAAGFACHPVMAHMRHGANIHCALRVEVGARAFLVDTGYLVRRPLELGAPGAGAGASVGAGFDAGPGLDEPLLLPAGQRGEGVPAGLPPGDFDLFTLEPQGPRWRYRLVLEAPSRGAFEEHWRRSFSLPGMRSLVVTRRDAAGARLYLHNHKLRRRGGPDGGGSTENVRQTLERAVEGTFGIDPRVTRRARELIARQRARGRGDGAAR